MCRKNYMRLFIPALAFILTAVVMTGPTAVRADVVIGPDKILLRDVEAWFPMMMYANSCKEVGDDLWALDVEELDYVLDHLEGTPFGLLDYSTPIGGYRYTEQMGDKCASRGIAWGLSLKDLYEPSGSGWPRFGQRERFFPGQSPLEIARELARRLKNHPALAFYYTNDELPTDDWHSQLKAMQDMLRAEDPCHPTVHQHEKDRIYEQRDCYDIYAHQFFNGGVRQIPQNFGRMPGIAEKVAAVDAPFWGCMDLHLSTNTSARFRTMCYGLIANGARGILFYAFHRMRELSRYDDDPDRFERDWDGLVEVAREIEGRLPILLQPLAKYQSTTTADDVALRTVTGEEGTWLLVVNAEEKSDRDITIYVDASIIEAVDEQGTEYPLRHGRLEFRLEPYDVYLIELRSEAPPPSPDFNKDGVVNFLDFAIFVDGWPKD